MFFLINSGLEVIPTCIVSFVLTLTVHSVIKYHKILKCIEQDKNDKYYSTYYKISQLEEDIENQLAQLKAEISKLKKENLRLSNDIDALVTTNASSDSLSSSFLPSCQPISLQTVQENKTTHHVGHGCKVSNEKAYNGDDDKEEDNDDDDGVELIMNLNDSNKEVSPSYYWGFKSLLYKSHAE